MRGALSLYAETGDDMKMRRVVAWIVITFVFAGIIFTSAVVLTKGHINLGNLNKITGVIRQSGDKTHECVEVPDRIINDQEILVNYDEDNPARAVSCWGDSMMEGVGNGEAYILTKAGRVDISEYTTPYTLGKLTGLETFNFGVSGEMSDEIARRAGGLKMYTDRDIYITDYADSDVCLVDDGGNPVYMFDFSGYGIEYNEFPDTVYINGVLCQINKKISIDDEDWADNRYSEFDMEDYEIGIRICNTEENAGYRYMYIPEGTVVTPKAAYEHRNDILVLEMGSNGGWEDYDELIAQYRAIIEYTGCTDYIIVGDTDDPGTSMAEGVVQEEDDYIGTQETTWETALREAFGEHFLNTREYLIENGLNDCGLRVSNMDRIYAELGFISTKLRFDWTHFNSYGYYSKGLALYKKGVELGYWE